MFAIRHLAPRIPSAQGSCLRSAASRPSLRFVGTAANGKGGDKQGGDNSSRKKRAPATPSDKGGVESNALDLDAAAAQWNKAPSEKSIELDAAAAAWNTPSEKSTELDAAAAQWNKALASEVGVPLSSDSETEPEPSAGESKTVDLKSGPTKTVDLKATVSGGSERRTVEADTESMTVDLNADNEEPGSRYNVEDFKREDPKRAQRQESRLEDLKRQLLTVTAGLDRGFSATASQARDVEDVVSRIEQAAGDVTLSWIAGGKARSSMDELGGVWRLVYTSPFRRGNLGGSRPGPPASLVPFSLGPVYQRIDTKSNTLDNVVQLLFPSLPLPFAKESPSTRICLRHSFVVQGSRKVEICYDSTSWEALAGEETAQVMGNKLQFELPALQRLLPRELRSAAFDVMFLDQDMRITRGDRNELRIYVRDMAALGASMMPDPDTANAFSSSES